MRESHASIPGPSFVIPLSSGIISPLPGNKTFGAIREAHFKPLTYNLSLTYARIFAINTRVIEGKLYDVVKAASLTCPVPAMRTCSDNSRHALRGQTHA